MGAAGVADDYCSDVPRGGESAVEAWIGRTCPKMELPVGDGCRELLWYVVEFCGD